MANARTLEETTYWSYPKGIGTPALNHWIQFKSYDFRNDDPVLDVALYMPPDALQTSYKASYDTAALGQGLGRAVEAIQDSQGSLSRLKKTQQIKAAATSTVIADVLLQSTTPENIKTALAVTRGVVANPYIVAAYKGPTDFREHKFSFQMMPEDENESKQCVGIVNAFKAAMLPDHSGGDNASAPTGLFGYPDEFEIKYNINGNPLPENNSNPLFNIQRSVLTGCDVSYTTQDLPVFFENSQYPASISMALTFMEIRIMTRGKIRKGF